MTKWEHLEKGRAGLGPWGEVWGGLNLLLLYGKIFSGNVCCFFPMWWEVGKRISFQDNLTDGPVKDTSCYKGL